MFARGINAALAENPDMLAVAQASRAAVVLGQAEEVAGAAKYESQTIATLWYNISHKLSYGTLGLLSRQPSHLPFAVALDFTLAKPASVAS